MCSGFIWKCLATFLCYIITPPPLAGWTGAHSVHVSVRCGGFSDWWIHSFAFFFFLPPISRRQCHSGRHTRADGSSGFPTSFKCEFNWEWNAPLCSLVVCCLCTSWVQYFTSNTTKVRTRILTPMHSFVAILFLFHGQRLNLQPCITLRILHIAVHSSTLISSTLLNRAVLSLLPAFSYPAAWRESPGFWLNCRLALRLPFLHPVPRHWSMAFNMFSPCLNWST